MRAPVTVYGILLAGLLLGCSSQELPPERRLAQDPQGNFVLHISNQSFAISLVDITVLIDGVVAVRDEFDVGKVSPQHEDKQYTFKLAPGKHVLKAFSINGDATLEQEFEMQDRRWAALLYECGGDARMPKSFIFAVKNEPMYVD